MKKQMKEDKKAKNIAKKVVTMGKMMQRHEESEMKSMKKKSSSKGLKKGKC